MSGYNDSSGNLGTASNDELEVVPTAPNRIQLRTLFHEIYSPIRIMST